MAEQKFKPGDSVAFINEKQSGIVVRYLTGKRLLVEIEDGFEIESGEDELVKVSSLSPLSKNKVTEEKNKPLTPQVELFAEQFFGMEQMIFTACIPENENAVLTGDIQLLLINKSKHKILYSFTTGNAGNIEGIASGICEPETINLLIKAGRSEIRNNPFYNIEVLLHPGISASFSTHIKKQLSIELPEIQNINKQFKGRAIYAKTIILADLNPPATIETDQLVAKFQSIQNSSNRKSQANPNPRGLVQYEKIVDLHIEELVDNIHLLEKENALNIQLNHFYSELDGAFLKNLKKVIFIHGVGNGVLKKAIRKHLSSVASIRFGDADFSKYGYGATEVILD